MYQEITEEELSKRMNLVDKFINSHARAKEILQYLHTLFPLEYVMPADFKGTHCITLKEDGKLQINVWCNNKNYLIIED
jgi:hypothetical protein